MCSSEELEFPHKLFEYQHGFLVSKTMFAACELGVFDLLHEVKEPVSAATIASRLSTSEDGMERLLDACVGLKLLKVDLRNNTGDFFNDPIPEADLFIVARVIHSGTEEKCLQLLTKIYQSCRPGGGVLIVELLLNEDRSGPVIAQMFSLIMLVQAEGKERTASEYTKLLTDCGFRDIEVKATGKMYDVILGRK